MFMASRIQRRAFSASARQLSKVTVLGAAGGIGQPLSLLLKLNPKGAEVVLIPAGVPRKPGMTRDDLFNTNASIVRDLAKAVAKSAPEAKVLVIANPVNSTVPIVREVFKAHGVYNPKTLFGVTTLDVDEEITVVGGHSGVTIVPLFSQSNHPDLSSDAEIIKRVQFGGDEVVKAKDGAGSATLSMAQAGARMADSVLRAVGGEKGVVEPSFVESPLYKDQGIDFFSSKVELGPEGVAQIHPVGQVDANETTLLEAALKDLKKNIEKGVEFVAKNPGN
uniref:malate dehydrogenase n=1 Tax=Bionectria ochroleuca TaxID=29856 RepID=A0A0B7KK10_BIOOC